MNHEGTKNTKEEEERRRKKKKEEERNFLSVPVFPVPVFPVCSNFQLVVGWKRRER